MRTLNLVMGIIYTIILSWLLLTGLYEQDGELIVGCVLMSGPVVANWITYSNLKKVK